MRRRQYMRATTKRAIAMNVVRMGVLLMTVSAGSHLAYATHFRYGHYNWKPAGGNAIEFTIQNAFRRDGYICRNPATLAVVPCTRPGGSGESGAGVPAPHR